MMLPASAVVILGLINFMLSLWGFINCCLTDFLNVRVYLDGYILIMSQTALDTVLAKVQTCLA